ncbi:GNAT family N-acetyltransferase [Buttiauxella ferragutiae]|uniref:GNAT family N-acetyltransferase n=2 Tax=Buttiauxella TaxID=82976 RepID=UPI0022B801E7|nr:GNAT family N-acetyltransferase [Buttiauxella ferragutiae]
MSALKKQRIDLRLTGDDKSMIEEAAAMSNQTITQFMVASASERAAEIIEQHRRLLLNEESWNLVMDAISNPPAPNERLNRAVKRLQNMKETLPSNSLKRKVPYANVPGVTLGRLAVHKSLQGQEWGSTLVTHAMNVVYLASLAVGVHGIFVDALNARAKQFYLKLGFIALTGSNENSLFYPTKSIEKLFEDQ